jgi:hypothetical protein
MITMKIPATDMNTAFTAHVVGSLDGLTAFSALPDAPVLPVEHRRSRLAPVRLARWRARGTPAAAPRWTPATTAGHRAG